MKYSLTTNTKIFNGITLYQIKAEKSFGDVTEGDLGGRIENESNLDQSGNARVFGEAKVSGNSEISRNSQISGNAKISGDAEISGNAKISGDAEISGNAQVSGDAEISGKTRIFGKAKVSGYAQVSGKVRISGETRLEAKKRYIKGRFIGGDDTNRITNITNQTGTNYWEAQYVLGDYKIEDIEDIEELTLEEVCERLGKKIKIV